MIKTTNLTKSYGRARGITDLTLHVPKGSSRIFFRGSRSRALQRAAASARQSLLRRSADRRMTSARPSSGRVG